MPVNWFGAACRDACDERLNCVPQTPFRSWRPDESRQSDATQMPHRFFRPRVDLGAGRTS